MKADLIYIELPIMWLYGSIAIDSFFQSGGRFLFTENSLDPVGLNGKAALMRADTDTKLLSGKRFIRGFLWSQMGCGALACISNTREGFDLSMEGIGDCIGVCRINLDESPLNSAYGP